MQSNFPNDNNEQYSPTAIILPPESQKSGCGFSGCLIGCGIVCLVLIITSIIAGLLIHSYCFKSIPLKVSPETTLVTTPLKSDGKSVDFYTVLKKQIEPQNPTSNNGFKNVLAAYGKELFINNSQEALNYDWIFNEICKAVELDPNFTPENVYKEPNLSVFLNGLNENNAEKESSIKELKLTIFDELLTKNWSIQNYPEIEEWLNKVNPGLDVVQKAAMEESYFIPMIRRNEQELALVSLSPPIINANAKLIHGLQIRSILQIGERNFDKAWDDILASFHLQRKLINKGIHLFNYNIPTEIKLQIIKTIAQSSSNWTPEQLNKAINDLQSIPQAPKREDLLLTAQYTVLDAFAMTNNTEQFVESIASLSFAARTQLDSLINIMKLFGFNWNIAAKKMNEAVTIYKKTINDEKNTEKLLNPATIDAQLDIQKFSQKLSIDLHNKMINVITVSGRSEVAGYIIGEIVPFTEKYIFKQTLNDEIYYRLLQTAFAIELYKSEHKKYPDSIDQLKLNPPRITAIKTNYKLTDKGYKISISGVELEFITNTD
ncbi:MAG: hypothetical protein LBE18_01285 [Planctomycetaceae bacterium]|jgi:hypothetical protein|nr:hypothetical protein [Planctomycetaceae bacterium]